MRGLVLLFLLFSVLVVGSTALRDAARRIADHDPSPKQRDPSFSAKHNTAKRDVDYYKRVSRRRHRAQGIKDEGPGDDVEGYDGAAIRQKILGKCGHKGSVRCPAPGGLGSQCVTVMSNHKSCGGCSTPDLFGFTDGKDCTALEHVRDARCVRGNCQIRRCLLGYKLVKSAEGGKSGLVCVEALT